MANKRILDHSKIDRILLRMAYELWEKNYDAKRILLVGISPKGPKLVSLLSLKLKAIECNIPVEPLEVVVNKDNPSKEAVHFSTDMVHQPGDAVVVVDDVLYTGSTMMHSIIPFIQQGFPKVQVAVLVFRDYLKYPISPDIVGIALASTTLQHVEVVLSDGVHEAYLN